MQKLLSIPFKGSPELAEAFAGKKPGEKCTICVTIQVNQNDEHGISGTVEEAAPMPSGRKSKEDTEMDKPMKPMSTVGKHTPKMMPVGRPKEEPGSTSY